MNIFYDECVNGVDGVLPKVDKLARLNELRAVLPDLEMLNSGEDLTPYE